MATENCPNDRIKIPLGLLFSTDEPDSITIAEVDEWNRLEAAREQAVKDAKGERQRLESSGAEPSADDRRDTVLTLLANKEIAISGVELVLGRRVDAEEAIEDPTLAAVILGHGSPGLQYEVLLGMRERQDALAAMLDPTLPLQPPA